MSVSKNMKSVGLCMLIMQELQGAHALKMTHEPTIGDFRKKHGLRADSQKLNDAHWASPTRLTSTPNEQAASTEAQNGRPAADAKQQAPEKRDALREDLIVRLHLRQAHLHGKDIKIPSDLDEMSLQELKELDARVAVIQAERQQTISEIEKLNPGFEGFSTNSLETLKIMLAALQRTYTQEFKSHSTLERKKAETNLLLVIT